MSNILDKQKVILGLSGGVDSTAAALLLSKKGLETTGLFLDVLGENEEGRKSAERTAEELGIKFLSQDVSQPFTEIVIENFCGEYLAGRTPNPCILCNPAVKFKTLLKVADKLSAQYIATGHYAKTVFSEGKYWIEKGKSEKKDQSYMLYRLSQDVLSRLILPLSDFESKEEVRMLADQNKLNNAQKKDSQEICFLPADVHYIDYLKMRGCIIPQGRFIDQNGTDLGTHKGLSCYTIGQRKGLGRTFGKPMFVTALSEETGDVILGENADLLQKIVVSRNNWFSLTDSDMMPKPYNGMQMEAKIRYAAKPSAAVLWDMGNGMVRTEFKEVQRAVTPGQSIVFYSGNRVIGGGIITKT